MQQESRSIVMVGLQKRYAPCIQILKQRLSKDSVISYRMQYITGSYPEGDAMTDLYIHALDLATYLFGKAEITACQKTTKDSYMLMLKHGSIIGQLELSTAYTWSNAHESLSVCTCKGIYEMAQLEQLTFISKQASCCGVPLDKIIPRNVSIEQLFCRNNLVPILANNQIYSQGFYNECKAFVDITEGRKAKNITTLNSIFDTFDLMADIMSKH